jgi:sugar-specific transcriptional regulator TrmB
MDKLTNQDEAIELLQQLGLKEYEAKTFVALSRVPRATAKEISSISEVPRTRVYDATRVLETKGLIETQHSSPQQFRAVPVEEAVGTLRREYDSRTDTLRETLQGLEPAQFDEDPESTHEVWSLAGDETISERTRRLTEEADRELVLVIGHEGVFTDDPDDALAGAQTRGVSVIVGTLDESLRERVERELPDIEVFVSGLDWLTNAVDDGDETEISRLLLVDRSTLLVSSFVRGNGDARKQEHAVFGRGFDNGFVAIARRLMATGLDAVKQAADDDD